MRPPTPFRRKAHPFVGVGGAFPTRNPTPAEIRGMSDSDLWTLSQPGTFGAETLAAIAREQRRREAWDSPDGWAFWISVAALAVAITAMLVSLATAG